VLSFPFFLISEFNKQKNPPVDRNNFLSLSQVSLFLWKYKIQDMCVCVCVHFQCVRMICPTPVGLLGFFFFSQLSANVPKVLVSWLSSWVVLHCLCLAEHTSQDGSVSILIVERHTHKTDGGGLLSDSWTTSPSICMHVVVAFG
jgi:hypothetical protein